MLIMVPGIVTLVNFVHLLNASSPIPVTLSPVGENSGIMNAPVTHASEM